MTLFAAWSYGLGMSIHEMSSEAEATYAILPEAARLMGHSGGPLYMRETHVGMVVYAHGEVNRYDDSDFYAIVWNPETQASEQVFYGTTRAWTVPNRANVDASPEVRAAYEAHRQAEVAREAKEVADREARRVRKGRTVTVARGRKVARGTSGVCIWTGEDNWGKGRCGIKLADGSVVWTATANCDVVGA